VVWSLSGDWWSLRVEAAMSRRQVEVLRTVTAEERAGLEGLARATADPRRPPEVRVIILARTIQSPGLC